MLRAASLYLAFAAIALAGPGIALQRLARRARRSGARPPARHRRRGGQLLALARHRRAVALPRARPAPGPGVLLWPGAWPAAPRALPARRARPLRRDRRSSSRPPSTRGTGSRPAASSSSTRSSLRHRVPRGPHPRADARLPAAAPRRVRLPRRLPPRRRPRAGRGPALGAASIPTTPSAVSTSRSARSRSSWRCAPTAPRGLGRRRGESRLPWTLLATDFWRSSSRRTRGRNWWADLLRGNILISLALANPVVPALALAPRRPRRACRATTRARAAAGWSLAAALAFAVPFFKVFLGAHLAARAGRGGALAPRRPKGAPLVRRLPCAVATAPWSLGTGGRTVDVALAPLDLVRITRESLGLAPLRGARASSAGPRCGSRASLGLRALRPARRRARPPRRPVAAPAAGGHGPGGLAAGPALPGLGAGDAARAEGSSTTPPT